MFAFYLFLWMIDELVRNAHGDFSLTLMALSLVIFKEGKFRRNSVGVSS
jgi:hypothetical protein